MVASAVGEPASRKIGLTTRVKRASLPRAALASKSDFWETRRSKPSWPERAAITALVATNGLMRALDSAISSSIGLAAPRGLNSPGAATVGGGAGIKEAVR